MHKPTASSEHSFRRVIFSSVFVLLATLSCSTPSTQTGPDTVKEIEESPKSAPGTETITILGTNDIHGALLPMQFKTRDAAQTPYEAGGLAYFASYVNRLRSELGGRLMWLDAGDEYQGTIESNSDRGATMVKFYNAAGLTAAAVGNHEFDFGAEPVGSDDVLGALKNRMSEARFSYLAANIYDKKSGRLMSFPNTLPSKIFRAGDLKVGVIGLSTLDTPTTTRPEYVAPLKFGDLKEATLREAKALRSSGAQLVLITAHAGLKCDLDKGQPGHVMRKPSDLQGDCDSSHEIPRLLRSLPAGTIDAVVSGHTHSVVHHWVAGVPVIQGGVSGRYFNLIHLTYDTKEKKLLPERTRIEGPIPVCPMVFRNQGDCNGDRPAPSIGRGPLTPPVFRKETIRADRSIEAVFQPAIEAAKTIKAEVYGKAARPIEHERYKESPLGNLVADGIRYAAKSDFALVNAGGVRAPIEQGTITYGNIFRSLPFDNSIVILHVNGKLLKQILKIAENGSRGFHSVSGLKLRLIAPEYDAPAQDLNEDKKIEPWEIDRLIEAQTTAGGPIDDNKDYTLATLDFLVSGGDDYGWVMSKIPGSSRIATAVVMRDSAAAYIRKLTSEQGSINSEKHPLVNPAEPRFKFEKPKSSKGTKKKSKRRSKKKSRSR